MGWLADGRRTGGGKDFLGKKTGKTQRADAGTATGEKLTTGTKRILGAHPVATQVIVHRPNLFQANTTPDQTNEADKR
jgi:hypothetical protein